MSDDCCLWLSTDSKEYCQIAAAHGLHAPFLRPKHLASDDSSSVDVVLHAMRFAESQGVKFDYIALIEPTSPFVKTSSIEKAIELLSTDKDANSIVSVKENRPNTFFVQNKGKYLAAKVSKYFSFFVQNKVKFLDTLAARLSDRKNLGRQSFLTEVTPSGGFYISKWDEFLENKTFYTRFTLQFMLSGDEELEIDEPIDFELAKTIIKAYEKK